MTQIQPTRGSRLVDERQCFACGPDNTHGLRLRFDYTKKSASCTCTIDRRFGGWSGMMHGGIVATLLDEAMAHAAIGAGVRAVTAKIEVRFRNPVPTGKALVLEGLVDGRRGRMLSLSAKLSSEDGILYAQAQGRFLADDG